MTVNLLDIIIIIPLLFFAYNGYKRGFIIELASLAALVAGLYMAFYFSDFAAEMLNDLFEMNQKYVAIIAFIMTFIVVIFLVITAGKIVQKFVDILLLGFFNKLAGAAFGVLKGALLLSIVLYGLNYFHISDYIIKPEAKQKSLFYQSVEDIAPELYSWIDSKNFNFDFPDKEEVDEAIDNVY